MSPRQSRAALSTAVSFVTLCKIIGIEEREGKEWKRVGLFEKGAPSYKELDAIRGAILRTLLRELDHDDAYMAWGRIRNGLGDAIFAPRLDVVCLIDEREARLCRTELELGEAISDAANIRRVEVASQIRKARQRFGREMESRRTNQPQRASGLGPSDSHRGTSHKGRT
jgi:hypothetical protein